MDTPSGGSGAGVRPAGVADLPVLTAMLTRAFADDPVARWACPRDDLRPWMLERFHAARDRQMLRAGEIWMTPGGESAAVWAAPGHWRSTLGDDLAFVGAMLRPSLIRRMPLIGWGLLGLERGHPPAPPHWYLATLGTEPAAQGRGLGTAVLAPVLEQCDHDGVAAYLESSAESNLDYYARFGFRVTAEHRLPRPAGLADVAGSPLTRAAGAATVSSGTGRWWRSPGAPIRPSGSALRRWPWSARCP